MAKKKRVKRSNIRGVKKSFGKVISRSENLVRSTKKKIILVSKILLISVILFVLSLALFMVTSNEVLLNFFYLLSIILGFVCVAFLIVLLALIFLKGLKK